VRVLCTYGPSSVTDRRAAGNFGPTKESLLRAIAADVARAFDATSTTVEPPLPGFDGTQRGQPLAVDTEYPWGEMTTVGLATDRGMVVWDDGTKQDADGSVGISLTLPGNHDKIAVITGGGKNERGKKVKALAAEGPAVPSTTVEEAEAGVGPAIMVQLDLIAKTLKEAPVLIGHSMAEDVRFLWENKLIPHEARYLTGECLVDTLLVSKMAYEGRVSYKLEDLLAEFYTVKGWKRETRNKKPWDWSPSERARRCQLDAWATYMLAKSQWPAIPQTLYGFTVRYAMVLHRMTMAGSIVDRTTYESIAKGVATQRYNLLSKLQRAGALLGEGAFDPTNDYHLRRVLFGALDLPVLERTRKAKLPSVDRPTLATLAESATGGTKGFLDALVEFSRVDKLHTTYTEGLNNLIHWGEDGGYLPFNFITLGARTGRRSSVNPNSQNWPVSMRRMVRSRYPGGSILELDYSKLEPRIIAYLAGCDKLLHFFTKGGGYLDVARELFRTEVKAGTPLYTAVKGVVLGVHYGMQTDLMALQLWQEGIRFGDWDAHWAETDRILNLYLANFPEIGDYMARCHAELAASGTVTGPTGRVLHLGGDGKHSRNQAINGPVQGTASDITGSALVDVEEQLLHELGVELPEWFDLLLAARKELLTCAANGVIMRQSWEAPVMFNEVHDSLLFDVPKGWEKKTKELAMETMCAVPTIRAMVPYLNNLPLGVEAKEGPTWGS
jgi:DNA polymerase I-like protein with 3'-5' exonuclease and polymerase domains